jgi:YfiH family protein
VLERRTSGAVVFYVSPMLERLGVPHGFSTRIGGVSEAPFDSMNLGNPSGCDTQDPSANIDENYRRFQSAIGAPLRRRCSVHQVHGGEIVDADAASFQPGVKADALISADPAKLLSVRTADCVPILLAGAGGRAVAAVHAGWRGVVAAALGAAVAALRDRGGDARDIVAAIGPCIGIDGFEVGDEVFQQFITTLGSAAPARAGAPGKWHVDLRHACRMQLESLGIAPGNIDLTDRCSFRDVGEFFSHRREHGITGRMASLIGPATCPGAVA